MTKNYPEIAQGVSDGASKLEDGIPDVMSGFQELGAATYREAALTPKLKELIALAISVTVRCDGCVGYHARSAHRRGASRDEVLEAIGVAIHMGGGPSMVYGAEALEAFDQFAGTG